MIAQPKVWNPKRSKLAFVVGTPSQIKMVRKNRIFKEASKEETFKQPRIVKKAWTTYCLA